MWLPPWTINDRRDLMCVTTEFKITWTAAVVNTKNTDSGHFQGRHSANHGLPDHLRVLRNLKKKWSSTVTKMGLHYDCAWIGSGQSLCSWSWPNEKWTGDVIDSLRKMLASKPAHAQYGKVVLVVVFVLQSKGPYWQVHPVTERIRDRPFLSTIVGIFCILSTAHWWLSWLNTGLSRGRSWVQLRPDQHSRSLNWWGKSAAFVMRSANG